jgi:PLP dependent protein
MQMTTNIDLTIKNNYDKIIEEINNSAIKAGRNIDDIHLVVVSKYKSVELIQAAINAGAHLFGENYPEQAVPKIKELRDNKSIEWHMIGHVQSRKAKIVAENFSLIHSLDTIKLAEKLNSLMVESSAQLRVLVEIKLSNEEAKSGWPAWEMQQWRSLLEDMEKIIHMPGLYVEGLMCMPPITDNPEESRPYFKQLRTVQEYLMKETNERYWKDLSIGTSADYKIAIEEGARYVRIGQAILGIREKIG